MVQGEEVVLTIREALLILFEISSIDSAAEAYPSWSPIEREAWDRLKLEVNKEEED